MSGSSVAERTCSQEKGLPLRTLQPPLRPDPRGAAGSSGSSSGEAPLQAEPSGNPARLDEADPTGDPPLGCPRAQVLSFADRPSRLGRLLLCSCGGSETLSGLGLFGFPGRRTLCSSWGVSCLAG